MNDIYVAIQEGINGDGLFYPCISIYFSGCDKKDKCKNCHNPELQDKEKGFKTNNKALIKDVENILISWLKIYPIISICYLGGEPLSPWNRESVLEISNYFKTNYKNNIKNIFYSWRYLEDLIDIKKYIKFMDFGVLGDFRQDLFIDYTIPASSNQYIYDFNNTKKLDSINKEDLHGNKD